eukprot:9079252-Heterocapsa_arctica.AAC.2
MRASARTSGTFGGCCPLALAEDHGVRVMPTRLGRNLATRTGVIHGESRGKCPDLTRPLVFRLESGRRNGLCVTERLAGCLRRRVRIDDAARPERPCRENRSCPRGYARCL